MERASDLIRGCAAVRITGAEPERVINACCAAEIDFWGVEAQGDFTLIMSVRQSQTDRVAALAESCLCEAETLRLRGGAYIARRAKSRPVLWVLPILLAAALVCSALFVWRIDVTGNVTVSDTEILNALDDCGVGIGAFMPSLSGEMAASRVTAMIPELKWVGISSFGSRVTVKVRERTAVPEVVDKSAPARIVAERGGLIEQMGTLEGYPLFENGQTAARGDVLIDALVPGKFDNARIVRAAGYVTARTWYELTAVTPLERSVKRYTGEAYVALALRLGDRRINFYRGSRILYTMCDNIVRETKLGVMGSFELPAALITETGRSYELKTVRVDAEEAKRSLEALLEKTLRAKIGAEGRVLKSEFIYGETEGTAVVTLIAECRQNIAREELLTETEISALEAELEETNDREDNGG